MSRLSGDRITFEDILDPLPQAATPEVNGQFLIGGRPASFWRDQAESLGLPIPPELEDPDLEEREIRVRITTVFGITIPITVRQGELSATVAIAELALTHPENPDEPAMLSFRLNRTGNRTVSGEGEVTYKSSKEGDEYIVGLVRGIAVLSPYPMRTVKFPLRPPEGVVIQNGRLHIVYRSRPEEGSEILAEADLQIP